MSWTAARARLKALNDGKGHAAGDDLLERVVATMRAHVRS